MIQRKFIKSELLHALSRLVDEVDGFVFQHTPGYREEDLQDAMVQAKKMIDFFRPIVLEEKNEG